jgi:hypothetical protein
MTNVDATETTPADMAGVAELEAFRQRCRAFLHEHATNGPPTGTQDAEDRGASGLATARAFQRQLTEAGLAGLT